MGCGASSPSDNRPGATGSSVPEGGNMGGAMAAKVVPLPPSGGKDAAEKAAAASAAADTLQNVVSQDSVKQVLSVFMSGSSVLIQNIGQVSGIACACIGIMGSIYVLLEAAANKKVWLKEFQEDLKLMAFDLAGSQAGFKNNPWLEKLEKEMNGVEALVKQIAGRGKLGTIFMSTGDRADLKAAKGRLREMREDALTSMLVGINDGMKNGFNDMGAQLKEIKDLIAAQEAKKKEEAEWENLKLKLHVEDAATNAVARFMEYYADSRLAAVKGISNWSQRVRAAKPHSFSDDNVYWINGERNAGKSVLSAAIVAELESSIGALHITADRKHARKPFRELLTSLAYQLAVELPEYHKAVNKPGRLDYVTSGFTGSDSEMFENLFVKPLSEVHNGPTSQFGNGLVTILIDGLEKFQTDLPESEGINILFDRRMMAQLPGWLGFVITSTHVIVREPYFQNRLDLDDSADFGNRACCRSIIEHQFTKLMSNADKGTVHAAVEKMLERTNSQLWLCLDKIENELKHHRPLTLEHVSAIPPCAAFELRKRYLRAHDAQLLKMAALLNLEIENANFHTASEIYNNYIGGSRAHLLSSITKWAGSAHGGNFTDDNVFWINGDRESGKSVLSAAVAMELNPNIVGLHIRSSGDLDARKGDPRVLWQTLAVQLAAVHPEYYAQLYSMRKDKKPYDAQTKQDVVFQDLFIHALNPVKEKPPPEYRFTRTILLIDGFEKLDAGKMNNTLDLLVNRDTVKSLPPWLAFLVTSTEIVAADISGKPYAASADLSTAANEENQSCAVAVLTRAVHRAVQASEQGDMSLVSAAAQSLASRSTYKVWYALEEIEKVKAKHPGAPITLHMIDEIKGYNISDEAKKKAEGALKDAKGFAKNLFGL